MLDHSADLDYQAFVASMTKHCRCDYDRPCDGVLAAGPCDERREQIDEYDDDDIDDDWTSDPDRICVGCFKREAILNHCCGMCTELHPEKM